MDMKKIWKKNMETIWKQYGCHINMEKIWKNMEKIWKQYGNNMDAILGPY